MPPRRNRDDRVKQDVTDISSAYQLLCYARPASWSRCSGEGFTQGRIARGAGLGTRRRDPGPALSSALKGPVRRAAARAG